jgi:hypothetical protein
MPTPLRNFRCPDETWQRAKRTAEKRGEPLSAVLVRALEKYAKSGGRAGGAD